MKWYVFAYLYISWFRLFLQVCFHMCPACFIHFELARLVLLGCSCTSKYLKKSPFADVSVTREVFFLMCEAGR